MVITTITPGELYNVRCSSFDLIVKAQNPWDAMLSTLVFL